MIARGVGCVTRTLGETVLAALPGARVGDAVEIACARGAIAGEVAAVERSRVAIVTFGALQGVAVGDPVAVDARAGSVPAGFAMLGRGLDASAGALDGKPDPRSHAAAVPAMRPPPPGTRRPVDRPFWTGVRGIDALLTLGRGARVGIFGAPGAGKTTLLATVVAAADADACVLALVGERGREAQAWLGGIGPSTTVICATSDRSAGERVRAAELAMTQAQTLRARGLNVVLIVDSLARYAAALRERKVALGEPVGRGGYPPSVWADLARYLERAGTAACGSITLIATVLSDGADEREPLSDAARSLLDGHLVLSSALAHAGQFPALDILASASRTMPEVVSDDHARHARTVRIALALLAESKDARALGLGPASAPLLGRAIAVEPQILAFLQQQGPASWRDSLSQLRALAAELEP